MGTNAPGGHGGVSAALQGADGSATEPLETLQL